MAKAVTCTVRSRAQAELVVERLKTAGLRATDISVLLSNAEGSKEFAVDNSTKAPEGAAAGAGTGAVLGGGLGWWRELAHWRFQAWGLSSQLGQLWPHSGERQLAARWEASLAPWSG